MKTRPKRVLHIMNAAVGGAAMSTLGLMRGFKKLGIESAAVCHSMVGGGSELDELRDATDGRVSVMPLYWWNKKTRTKTWKRPLLEARQALLTGHGYGSATRVASLVREHGCDLIHTNTIVTPEGAHVARLMGLPHVWHVRELVGKGQHVVLPMEGEAMGRYFDTHASMLVANSHATASMLAPYLSADRLRVVPNGIELDEFDSLLDVQRSGKKIIVGMIANVTSEAKNHALFIRALSYVKSLNVEFRVYGYDNAGAYGENLKKLAAQLGVSERLLWRGFVPSPVEIMRELDVVLHPMHNEGFGRIVVEAMAAGLPVVGVRGGGVGEIVVDNETGFLAEPNDPITLGARVDMLAESADLRVRLGRAGRKRAEQLYSIQACVNGVLEVYESAMQSPVKRVFPLSLFKLTS